MEEPKTKIGVGHALSSGYNIWQNHFSIIIAITLSIIGLPLMLQSYIEISVDEESLIRFLSSLAQLIVGFANLALSLGILKLTFDSYQHETPADEDQLTTHYLKFALNNIFRFIPYAIGAGFIVLGYTLLLIIPGIYKLTRLTFFDCFFVVGKDQPIDESEELVEGRWGKVFVFLLLTGSLNIGITLFSIVIIYLLFGDELTESIQTLLLVFIIQVAVSLVGTYITVVKGVYFMNLLNYDKELKKLESPIDDVD